MSLAGTALIYPGKGSINWISELVNTAPFVSGLGSFYIAWCVLSVVAFLCAAVLMLSFRAVLRKEDPFHQIIWVRPGAQSDSMLVVSDLFLDTFAHDSSKDLSSFFGAPEDTCAS